MQQNFQPKNRSQLIKNSNDAKNKAKRKLIGSIAILLIALVLLLNVTSKVKPIPVTPQIISFSHNLVTQNQTQIAQNNNNDNNNNVASNPISTPQPQNTPPKSSINNKINSTQIINKSQPENKTVITELAPPTETSQIFIKPRIINVSITKHPNPEEILNGIPDLITTTRYYVQIATATNKPAIQQLKQWLLDQNIASTLQQIDTPNGIVFRLRVGPFEKKPSAISALKDIQDEVAGYDASLSTDNN